MYTGCDLLGGYITETSAQTAPPHNFRVFLKFKRAFYLFFLIFPASTWLRGEAPSFGRAADTQSPAGVEPKPAT